VTHSDDKTIIRPDNERLHIAITYADLVRLIAASIAAPAALRFGIFHGVSNNRWKGMDLSDTRAILGYAP